MKLRRILTSIILISSLTFNLTSCDNKPVANEEEIITEQDTTKQNQDTVSKTQQPKENPYDGLRNMAFTVKPEQLGLSLPADKTIVYGVIMDWGLESGIATTVTYQTGDASLYLSSGGGVIGGGQYPNVNSAAKKFVVLGQTFLRKATKTAATPSPGKDVVKFYFLTNKGIYVGEDQMKNFDSKSSPWFDLFEEGNKVLTELRMTSEKQ
jgi:hypothetical protein